nr:dual specificity protein phosphatase [Candidatus Sigynarchaeota archaeon]
MKSEGIDYLKLNLREETEIDDAMANSVIQFIEAHVSKRRNTLVHCQAGMQRSPAIIAVYLLSCGCQLFDALNIIKKKTGIPIATEPMLRSVAKLKIYHESIDQAALHQFLAQEEKEYALIDIKSLMD